MCVLNDREAIVQMDDIRKRIREIKSEIKRVTVEDKG